MTKITIINNGVTAMNFQQIGGSTVVAGGLGASEAVIDTDGLDNQGKTIISALKSVGLIDIEPSIKPGNTTLPEIQGVLEDGETVTVTDGDWDGSPVPVITYQWTLDAGDIAGATENSLEITADMVGHVLGCVVTGTNPLGTANVAANGSGQVN